jgi:hypothetical protein
LNDELSNPHPLFANAINRSVQLICDFQELNSCKRGIADVAWRIGKTLKRYRLRPLIVLPDKGNNWTIQWTQIPFGIPWAPAAFMRGQGSIVSSEGDAVVIVLSLAQKTHRGRRLIDQIKRCKHPECRVFFFATRESQDFHSMKCQQRFYKSSPEWKRRRKKQDAKYRRWHGLDSKRKNKHHKPPRRAVRTTL